MLRYPLADRKTLTALSNLRVRAPNGVEAPLEEVATIELGQGYQEISRRVAGDDDGDGGDGDDDDE